MKTAKVSARSGKTVDGKCNGTVAWMHGIYRLGCVLQS